MIFLVHILSADRISANPKKVDKVRDWLVPSNAKELHSVYAWHLITAGSYQILHTAKCLHQLVGPTNVKKTKGKRKEVISLENQEKPDLTLPKFVWHLNIKRLLTH